MQSISYNWVYKQIHWMWDYSIYTFFTSIPHLQDCSYNILHSICISHVTRLPCQNFLFCTNFVVLAHSRTETKTYVFLLYCPCFCALFVRRHHMHFIIRERNMGEKLDWLKTKYLTITCGSKSFWYTFFVFTESECRLYPFYLSCVTCLLSKWMCDICAI